MKKKEKSKKNKVKLRKKISKVEKKVETKKEIKIRPVIKVEEEIKPEKDVGLMMEMKPEINVEKTKVKIPKKEVEKPKKIKRRKYKHRTPKKEEVKPKKRIGGGSFIASGVLSILVPAMFYVVLGDFSSFLQDCSLPFSDVNIGSDMIVNCTEMRLVYVISFLCVFFGAILIIYGLAKKIVEIKKTTT